MREPMKLTTCSLAGIDWEVDGSPDNFTIEMAAMYASPPETDGGLTFPMLEAISNYFGTSNIHVNEVSESGCETCDYGSLYGLRIIIMGATKGTDAEKAVIEVRK